MWKKVNGNSVGNTMHSLRKRVNTSQSVKGTGSVDSDLGQSHAQILYLKQKINEIPHSF